MINAWSLAYDVLNGTLDENFPVKKKTMTDEIKIEGADKGLFNVPIDATTPEYEEPIVVSTGNTAFSTATAVDSTVNLSTESAVDPLNLNVPDYWDSVSIDTSNWDTVSFGDEPLAFSTLADNDDSISHHVTTPGIQTECTRKYKEDESIKALQDYISTTYGGHYTSRENNVQTLDLIESVGDAESFCRSNAIKYLSRYDKKGQAKRDILKALHYTLLLYHFSGQLNETQTRGYETF